MACSSTSSNSGGLPAQDAGTGTTPPNDSGSTPPGDVPTALANCTRDPGAPATQTFGASDPIGSADKFKLEDALAGFPSGSGKFTAAITTEKGVIVCKLDETAAPVSVANFIGLARGTRPYKEGGTWKTGRFYDGKTWHRVIPNFVIQGGDPLGTGTGGPGYTLPNENHVAEPKGALAMAASTEPSGSQFYIVVGEGPAADYNVFGSCETPVAESIAAVDRDKNDMPKTAVHMSRIDIARCP
jgi:peptidyl-prolyl cis-trans isomerase A (cyclophilin A)